MCCCRGFCARIFAMTIGWLCMAVQWVLSLLLASCCLLPLLWATAVRIAQGLATYAARWAWHTVAQAAWEALAGSWPGPDHPSLLLAAANATALSPVPTYLPEVVWGYDEVQAWGSAWTWGCMALSLWRHRGQR